VTESHARRHDAGEIREAPPAAGDAMVFDRGHTDYEHCLSLCGEKVCFVPRLKSNTKYGLVGQNEVPKGKGIKSDYEIPLKSGEGQSRLSKSIVYDRERRKQVVSLTNNMKWSFCKQFLDDFIVLIIPFS
jgi:hypothetical protein